MPPWVASVPRLTIFRKTGSIDRIPLALRCRNVPKSPCASLRARSASTHVSPTAINLRPNVPPRNQELYDALSALSGAAETHVNISRLQLALRGLAAQDAVTRVAVLGLNSQLSAQQLARLLLADPLAAEGQWEKELAKAGVGSENAVLLKYGTDPDDVTPSPLYRVLAVPSRVLQSHNIEVLVSTVNVNVDKSVPHVSTESSIESLLVPKLQATSARGLPVPYPVHKTLILGVGLDSAISYGRFSADGLDEMQDMVKLAIDLPVPSSDSSSDPNTETAAINIAVGAKGLDSFRESIKNATVYERAWFQSGLPTLSQWLVRDLQPSNGIKPPLRTLIVSVADGVEASVAKADAAQLQKLATVQTDDEVTASILGHLETWAEKSHAELRDQLDEAFVAKNWHKLAWWKLLWRVDDVTMISSEILERRWLVSAEKNSVYLAGRMNQAGFPDEIQRPIASSIPEATTQDTAPTAENQRMDLSTNVRKPMPWHEQISNARTELINDTVPPLQALAQRLLLQTFSTTSISSAASALLYVSMSSFSVFEASAVAALGLTFSLRRMQKLWEGARETWQATVREEGRRTLKSTEEGVRFVIENAEKKEVVEEEDVRERRAAREAVRRVREVLEKMGGGVDKGKGEGV
ncbi:hypothetical protein COCC4DRAFT_162123 [Bipolaris maydis ATCC 48331]|uniref:Mmc1 C-terminal domain-containing protein n=3 Tax=Cochliobolus heterostrophus TaxID=5016 RepID=M2UWQ7_COCH5|nr:uncharacterized protein COCC4DRAFT_162123 [Bipolaris maydis ATCC 48331]EMD92253.1 hypothetical protein COCHEDRAFT_1134542 [Bipolaris maydis C5]KAH7550875.1 hypothetical protein BM1_10248 [Bipolaris maydis]ENI07945.1 hypothetical protein COCC4DRAFT_162123 [Bipolaris maydis ATCC 48331]KAJ5060789.1 hypothetical protein J3E74DRAFT_417669 [Bipolaris maydis]KAJ6197927.1 hypothetical protein J3E72DRAFT_240532 [Bipolaris maydis]